MHTHTHMHINTHTHTLTHSYTHALIPTRTKDDSKTIGRLDPDTTVSHHSGLAALKAAGAVCTAVDRVLSQQVEFWALCICSAANCGAAAMKGV